MKGKFFYMTVEFVFVITSFLLIKSLFSQGVQVSNVQLVTVLIFASVALPLLFEIKSSNQSVLSCKNVVLMGPLIWILIDGLTMRDGIEIFPPEVILQVFVMILVFISSILLGYFIKSPSLFINYFKGLDYGYDINKHKTYVIALFCLVLGLLPLVIWGGGLGEIIRVLTSGGRWAGAWGRARIGGTEDYIKSILMYFLIVGLQLSWFYSMFIKKSLSLITLSFIGLMVIFNSGTRSFLLAVVAPLAILYYLREESKNKKPLFNLILFCFAVLVIMQFQFIIRQGSTNKGIVTIVKNSYQEVLSQTPLEYHRDDQFFQLLKYASFVPDKIPYSGEILIFRPFWHFIPRFLWPDKPEGITRPFEEMTNERGMSVATWSASIIGDFYLCQGWLGVIIAGLLMGFLAKQFDSLREMAVKSPAVMLIYSYGLVFLFTSIRSFQIIIEGWYVFILMYIILRVLKKRARRQLYT